MGVGVRLDGGQRRIRGIGLLHREERATGFSAGHFDLSLVAIVTTEGGRGTWGLLGGEAIVVQLVLGCDWLPVIGVGLLSLQLLLFPPDVIQQDLTVSPSSSSSSSPCPSLSGSVNYPRSSVHQQLGAPEHSRDICSPGHWHIIYPQSSMLCTPVLLWGGDTVQEAV